MQRKMTENQQVQKDEALPEAFVEQVKQALEHLYDLPYLQSHPLVQEGGSGAARTSEIPGQHLRRHLAAAIEALNPGAGVPFSAPHARLYNLLRLRYVEQMTVREAASELGLSLRQAHRDLRHGEESVAAVLWARRSAPLSAEPNAAQLSTFQAEMARLEVHPRPIDIRTLLQRAQEAVEPQAAQRNVCFHAEMPAEPVVVSTDPVVAEQVLVNTLSYAVRQAYPASLYLVLKAEAGRASIALHYFPETDGASAPVVNLVVAQLADRLGWMVRQEDQPDGSRAVLLHMAVHGPAVLVIDDNEGLVQLLDRYLTDQACRVIAAANGQEGLNLAQEVIPDAIVLDVMMPGIHGWELLQRLRNHPRTANVPVIICSVINNPELAYSLGASMFLPKPVSRDDVLGALRELGVV
jgi:CheY-like chemotaxis protein